MSRCVIDVTRGRRARRGIDSGRPFREDTGTMDRRLEIAPHTVEWHVRHVIEKLQVHSKLQAVLAATRLGIIGSSSRL
jgi:hypothetical protein